MRQAARPLRIDHVQALDRTPVDLLVALAVDFVGRCLVASAAFCRHGRGQAFPAAREFYWRWLAALGFVVVFLDIVLLAGFDTPHWAFDLLLWGAAGYTSRAWLVWQHGQRRDEACVSAQDNDEIVDLPQQTSVLDRLASFLVSAETPDGRLVALRGSWGAGKTVILRRLARALETCARCGWHSRMPTPRPR